jgi:hypothetical protein
MGIDMPMKKMEKKAAAWSAVFSASAPVSAYVSESSGTLRPR